VRIHGELASELVPMRLLEPSSDGIPIKYAKPDRLRATGELVLLNGVQDCVPPALTSLEFLDSELREPTRMLMSWLQKWRRRRQPNPADARGVWHRSRRKKLVPERAEPVGAEIVKTLLCHREAAFRWDLTSTGELACILDDLP